MLLFIKYILFKFKLRSLSEADILHLEANNYVDRLEYALANGNFKVRKLAAEALGHVGQASSIPYLFIAIQDKVHNVSLAALDALDKLDDNKELKPLIVSKRFQWMKSINEKEAAFEANRGKKYKIYRWERTSKKNFEIVKEQLKKRIR
jgi:HEAT repeat protein